LANEVHDLDDDPEGHWGKTMYQITVSGPEDQSAMAAARTMDLEYIDMMSRHHAGAQTMLEDYISDERGTNPILRKLSDAIITNQGFELAILTLARESVSRPPTTLDFGFARIATRELGVDGLEHRWRFIPKHPPGRRELALLPPEQITEFDVAFANGMMIHHQAAVGMAWKYNQDPIAQNRVLRLMNLDIIREQLYEIGLLGDLVSRYPGDAGAVEPTMPLGMDMGGMHGQGMMVDPGSWQHPDLPLGALLTAIGIVPAIGEEEGQQGHLAGDHQSGMQ